MTDNGCCSSGCGCDCGNIPPHKMCQLTKNAHGFDIQKVKMLTSDPKHICACCGRTANDANNLCSPVPLR